MNRFEKRVRWLEGGHTDEVTVVAQVPLGWPKERQEAEVTALAIEQGAVEPFDLMIFEQPVSEIERAYVGFIGDFGELLNDIAREGRRIDDRPS